MEAERKEAFVKAIAAFRREIPERFDAYSHEPVEKGDINELATYIISVFNELERLLVSDDEIFKILKD